MTKVQKHFAFFQPTDKLGNTQVGLSDIEDDKHHMLVIIKK